MRLTLAVSLIATDVGVYGTAGPGYATRNCDLFGDNTLIEDYYDEYAVDYWGRGFHNTYFQWDYWDENSDDYWSDDLLLGAKYYLGTPLVDSISTVDHFDLIYREFDHGVVIAHLGICSQMTEADLHVNNLVLADPPSAHGHHFMRIRGCELGGYHNRYNDHRNYDEHNVTYVVVDDDDDDDTYGRGDAIILLKEGDGFYVHPNHQQ
jgi:hypothetical protein